MSVTNKILALGAVALVGGAFALTPAHAWEPTHPIEIIVPAGTGGGADQMARDDPRHHYQAQSVETAGGGRQQSRRRRRRRLSRRQECEGQSDHKLIITLSNLFTTPLATGIPFNWKDLTPVAMMALDEFILWTNAEKPYKTAKDYIDAIKAAPDNTFKMGGTGSKQEDQIITVALREERPARR